MPPADTPQTARASNSATAMRAAMVKGRRLLMISSRQEECKSSLSIVDGAAGGVQHQGLMMARTTQGCLTSAAAVSAPLSMTPPLAWPCQEHKCH